MRKLLFAMPIVLLASVLSMVSHAADVVFDATVLQTCTVVATPGVMAANGEFDVLSSKSSVSGGAAVTATDNSFDVTLTNPSGFTLAPATGGDNVTFLTEYSASGATTIAQTDTATAPSFTANSGTTTLAVDLTASKPSGEFFVTGAYAATVIVTCAAP